MTSLEHCTKNIGKTLIFEGIKHFKNKEKIKKQIIENQIKAENYFSDEEHFSFEDIKEEFEKYGEYLLKEKEKKLEKEKIKQNIKTNKIKLNKNDYGLSI